MKKAYIKLFGIELFFHYMFYAYESKEQNDLFYSVFSGLIQPTTVKFVVNDVPITFLPSTCQTNRQFV